VTIVIFGASGDLTKRKLLPSLYNLGSYHLLPTHFSIIGVARRPLSDDLFRDQLGKDLAEFGTQPVDPNLWSKFQECISYCAGEFDDPATYIKLADVLSQSETKFGTSGNVVFYLSVQPDYFAMIAKRLSESGLLREENGRWRRVAPGGPKPASPKLITRSGTFFQKIRHLVYFLITLRLALME
jgi:glucose-6-phosphate 1-dehydrogenase